MTTATYDVFQDADKADWQPAGLSLQDRFVSKANALFARKIERLRGVIQDAPDGATLAERALEAMGVSWSVVNGKGLELPAEGPVAVISNHPYGGVEGLMLLSLICRTRMDVKILATDMLGVVPELRPYLILVDTDGDRKAARRNVAAMRQCLRWLENGGVLGVFPAGEVAHFDPALGGIREGQWNTAVARLVRRAEAAVAPAYFGGANGLLFQAAGLVHPRLRTAMLARELFNKRRRPVRVAVAKPVPFKWLRDIGDDRALTDHLRMRVSLLAFSAEDVVQPRPKAAKKMGPVAEPSDRMRQVSEVSWLSQEQQVLTSGDYSVYVAGASQIPAVLREIGRLREIAFRGVGEGCGKAVDLDRFDEYYQHLFLWNHREGEVVGAYRLGMADVIVETRGMKGLYTHTLFNFRRRLFDQINPAIELGRSFVRPEYQRSHLPLLLLWRGIGRFVASRLRHRYLFGTVSMSRSYTDAARGLVAWYFDGAESLRGQDNDVRPRRPLRWGCGTVPLMQGSGSIRDATDIDRLIAEMEPDGKGLPVLLRQYLRLGGRVLACNVDPDFSMALDALVVVDLCKADPRLLENCMGPATRDYLAFHNAGKRIPLQNPVPGDVTEDNGEPVCRSTQRCAAPERRGIAHLAMRQSV